MISVTREGQDVVLDGGGYIWTKKLTWKEANQLAEKILDVCEAIVDDMPEPPVVTITQEQFDAQDYPDDVNIRVLDSDGKVSFSMSHHLKPLIR